MPLMGGKVEWTLGNSHDTERWVAVGVSPWLNESGPENRSQRGLNLSPPFVDKSVSRWQTQLQPLGHVSFLPLLSTWKSTTGFE
jgi:hypothetical protein